MWSGPARGFGGALADAQAVAGFAKQAEAQKSVDFFLHIIPDTVVGAFATRRNPAGAAVFDPVRLCADGPWRARPHHARLHRRRRACGVRRHRHRDEGGADRRVRRDGLHHRQVRHRRDPEPDRPDRDVLRHRGAVRVRGARHHRADGRFLDLQVPGLHQGRAADRARHVVLGKRAAVPDGKARAARLLQVGGRPRGADRLLVQPRRHQYLHDAGDPVHCAGARLRSHASASSSPSCWSRC